MHHQSCSSSFGPKPTSKKRLLHIINFHRRFPNFKNIQRLQLFILPSAEHRCSSRHPGKVMKSKGKQRLSTEGHQVWETTNALNPTSLIWLIPTVRTVCHDAALSAIRGLSSHSLIAFTLRFVSMRQRLSKIFTGWSVASCLNPFRAKTAESKHTCTKPMHVNLTSTSGLIL